LAQTFPLLLEDYQLVRCSGLLSADPIELRRKLALLACRRKRFLYVADTGVSHAPDGPKHIRRFKVEGDRLSGGEVFADCTAGAFDGFRLDTQGRVWSSAADGVHCFDPDGTLIGKIRTPELVANLTFGGPKRNRLLICGTTSLYSVFATANGSARG
jgi:gluconolactonase